MGNRHVKLEERALAEAMHCILYHATVREIAKKFGVSKSTVYKDLTERIERESVKIAVRRVLEENKAARALRGGFATKRKYYM